MTRPASILAGSADEASCSEDDEPQPLPQPQPPPQLQLLQPWSPTQFPATSTGGVGAAHIGPPTATGGGSSPRRRRSSDGPAGTAIVPESRKRQLTGDPSSLSGPDYGSGQLDGPRAQRTGAEQRPRAYRPVAVGTSRRGRIRRPTVPPYLRACAPACLDWCRVSPLVDRPSLSHYSAMHQAKARGSC